MKAERTLGKLSFGVLFAALSGCASGGQGDSQRVDANLLQRAEVEQSGVTNLYDAVERLRPRWLQIRSPRSLNSQTQIVVFMNRSYLGGPEVLRQFDAKSVDRLRYLDGSMAAATLRLPSGTAVEGAIVLETAGGGGR